MGLRTGIDVDAGVQNLADNSELRMEWQRPQFLYLILPLCVSWLLLALYSDRRRQLAWAAFVAQAMWSRVLPEASRTRFWLKLILQQLTIVSGLMAMARPQFGTQYEQVVPRGSDLYVLIDVSRSMLADDVPPSRLERAKADVSALVNRLEGERIGLVAFAGQAVVKCPLTVDYDSFRRALNELDPDSAPRGGTAIGDAIRKALEVFQTRAERDQAILLITDGDDQSSYPQEAATVAAERKVTIFTVGLGDSEQGSRIPQKANSSTFVEHDGQQVWSKLDGKLLQEIAIKTSGVYIPAGTRAYDLGELYVSHLQGRKGDDAASQQRIRRSERFQIFLAITLLMLLVDLWVSPFVPAKKVSTVTPAKPAMLHRAEDSAMQGTRSDGKTAAVLGMLVSLMLGSSTHAGDSENRIRQGLKLYQEDQFEEAAKEFAAAGEELDKEKSVRAAIAAFDEACAFHRKGDLEKAKDLYLKAGLSPDRAIATSSHFNLGTLSAEQAKKLAGEKPEEVPTEKREEILGELKQAVASYRHCLELQPNHVQSRRNLELVRNWIKYYSDRWRERDRQKVRDESNLLQFLEFLTKTQSSLQETVTQLPPNVSADAFAELKRAQDELSEEIPTLREKIETELRPADPATGGSAASQPTAPPQQPNSKEIEEGIALLQGWANKAGDRMSNASRRLGLGEPANAVTEQKAALEELDRIWDAVVPFHPLLAKELADQTTIASQLKPSAPLETRTSEGAAPTEEESVKNAAEPIAANASETDGADKPIEPAADPTQPTTDQETTNVASNAAAAPSQVVEDTLDFPALKESQSLALRKTRLLAPKAEAELAQFENQLPADVAAAPPVTVDSAAPQADSAQKPKIDPEAVQAGYRKAIELAPKAVEEMESAVRHLEKEDRLAAATHAEEARRILEGIHNAQPKNEQKDQDKQDQENKDQQDQQNQDNKKEEDTKDDGKVGDKDQKQDEKKSDEQKQNDKDDKKEKKKDSQDKKKSDDKKSDQEKQSAEKQQQQVSKDRIEDALRKVRERQQEKRERDREARARIMGRSPVDKDW